MLVPKEHNAKGIALLISGDCNIYKAQKASGREELGTQEEILAIIIQLSELLISLQCKGYSGSCWGYNFDWQARRLFLFPKNTPTVVATAFCASALFDAYEITGNKAFRDVALSSADFVLKDLKRTPHHDGFLFSYSPLDGNNTVYNASLMGSKLLSLCYHYSANKKYAETARKSVLACIHEQADDGSWVYGMLPVQNWIDSFHTGYILDALKTYQEYCRDDTFSLHIEKGFDFYIKHFFEQDGTPKYYHNETYPIDIHCPAQLFVTLNRLNKQSRYSELAENVLKWTIKNMQHRDGYFYYQLKKGISSKIPYMRWSNAFMLYGMSHLNFNKNADKDFNIH